MRDALLPRLGAAVRQARQKKGLSQTEVAVRVGRAMPRISELESDLLHGRLGRDRLALLAEVCDALGLVLLAVPREQVQYVEALVGSTTTVVRAADPPSLFEDLFVDLSEGGEEADLAATPLRDEEPR